MLLLTYYFSNFRLFLFRLILFLFTFNYFSLLFSVCLLLSNFLLFLNFLFIFLLFFQFYYSFLKLCSTYICSLCLTKCSRSFCVKHNSCSLNHCFLLVLTKGVNFINKLFLKFLSLFNFCVVSNLVNSFRISKILNRVKTGIKSSYSYWL